MTQKEEDIIIDQIIKSLRDMDLGDIKYYTGLDGQNPPPITKPLAIYILCACFIDHMAQYNFYDPKKDGDVGGRFIAFVKEYFKKYDAIKLYTSLRSNLVHNYSTKGTYFLDWEGKGPHLSTSVDSKNRMRIWLQLNEFIADIEAVFQEFCKRIRVSGSDERKSALAHYDKYEIFQEL